MGLTADAYGRQLKQLLPRGPIWRLEPTSWISRTLLAIAEELARVDGRSDQLLEEWDPATSGELLADWERVLGLPISGTTLPAALADRQLGVALAYVARGGQSEPYFYELAALAGFVVVIGDVAPYVWRMTVDLAQARVAYSVVDQVFRVGDSRMGDRLASITVPELEAVVLRARPAHTQVWFLYLNA